VTSTEREGAERAAETGRSSGDSTHAGRGPSGLLARRSSPGRGARVAVTVVGILLLAWFFVAWLLLERHIVDAASESVGTAFGLLLLVSLVGAVRSRLR
jgi:hypothetical protein